MPEDGVKNSKFQLSNQQIQFPWGGHSLHVNAFVYNTLDRPYIETFEKKGFGLYEHK